MAQKLYIKPYCTCYKSTDYVARFFLIDELRTCNGRGMW